MELLPKLQIEKVAVATVMRTQPALPPLFTTLTKLTHAICTILLTINVVVSVAWLVASLLVRVLETIISISGRMQDSNL